MGNAMVTGKDGNAGAGRMAVVHYVGDGLNSKSISFPFTPKIVLLIQRLTYGTSHLIPAAYTWGAAQFAYGTVTSGSSSGAGGISASVSGNTMTISPGTSARFNSKDVDYTAIAFE